MSQQWSHATHVVAETQAETCWCVYDAPLLQHSSVLQTWTASVLLSLPWIDSWLVYVLFERCVTSRARWLGQAYVFAVAVLSSISYVAKGECLPNSVLCR